MSWLGGSSLQAGSHPRSHLALQAEQAARRKAEELLKQSVESEGKLRAQLKGEVSKRR